MKQKNDHFFSRMILGTILTTLLVMTASATDTAGIKESTVYTGMLALVDDLTSILMVLCPMVGGVAALYCVIRRSMADEQDGKMWTKRISTAIICGVAGMLVSGLINLLKGYFILT